MSEARDTIAEAVFRGVITSLQEGGCMPGWQSAVADSILAALKEAGWVVVKEDEIIAERSEEYLINP